MAKMSEYKKFDQTMRQLISVPRSQLKAKLEAEKAGKKRKSKRPSASHDSSDREGA